MESLLTFGGDSDDDDGGIGADGAAIPARLRQPPTLALSPMRVQRAIAAHANPKRKQAQVA